MRFEWDQKKNLANRRKHRVSFETATLVFEDPRAISVLERMEEGEVGRQRSLANTGDGRRSVDDVRGAYLSRERRRGSGEDHFGAESDAPGKENV